MFNMLRMDLQRLFKSRSFYIILSVTAVLLVMVTVMAYAVADPEMMDAMEAQGAEITESDRIMSEYIQNMSQLDLMHETLGSGFLLVMTGIGMTLFVNGDFSSGFVKNICCVQPRRVDYVLAKALTAGVYSGIITVLGAALILSSPYFYGLRPQPCAVPDILGYVVLLWLPHWAFALMALALVLLTRSTTLGIILSLVAGSGLTAVLLGTALCSLPYAPITGPGWSAVATDYAGLLGEAALKSVTTLLPKNLYQQMGPGAAVAGSFLLLFLCLLLMGAVLLAASLLRVKPLGIAADTALLLVGAGFVILDSPWMWGFPCAHALTWLHYHPYFRALVCPLWVSWLYFLLGAALMTVLACVSAKRRSFDSMLEFD